MTRPTSDTLSALLAQAAIPGSEGETARAALAAIAPRLAEEVLELRAALELAHRALTEGLADVPPSVRDRRCAALRAEAKRVIRRVLEVQQCGR